MNLEPVRNRETQPQVAESPLGGGITPAAVISCRRCRAAGFPQDHTDISNLNDRDCSATNRARRCRPPKQLLLYRGAGQDQQVTMTAVNAISDMVAPVVLLTVGGMLTNGLLGAYSGVSDRLREMTRERIEIRSGPDGTVLDLAKVGAIGRERLAEIDHQVPTILARLHRTRIALLLIYIAIAVFGLSIIAIAVAVSEDSEAFGQAALGLVLAGTVLLLVGIVVAAISLVSSADAITYAVERTRSLGK
jgi:Protein of unknown function (DUF2721)